MRRRDLLVAGGAGAALAVLASGPPSAAHILGCKFRDASELAVLKRERGFRLLYEDGTFMAGLENYYAPLVAVGDLPRHLIQALVVSEDKRFFEHDGIDYLALLRAAARNARALGIREGASTITQQTLKNACFRGDPRPARKLKELLLAGHLEGSLSKPEILNVYLNSVFFGGRAYGIEAAARVYLGKYARELTPLEAALLVQLLPAPNQYNPHTDPELALRRARRLLDRMAEGGHITRSVAVRGRWQKPSLAPPQRGLPGFYAHGPDVGWPAEWAKRQAERRVAPARTGVTTVVTTLRPELQGIAARHLRAAFEAYGERLRFDQGAVVVMALDGDVLAMVGGRDFHASQWNNATQAKRQPGSAFKLFVYLAALERGLRLTDKVLDEPLTLKHGTIKNHDGEYRGLITLREAFVHSSNPAAVRLALGHVPAIAGVARRLGIGALLGLEAGIALGDKEVTLVELTAAYAAIANRGLLAVPTGVIKIRDNFGAVAWHRGRRIAPRRVVNARHAKALHHLLAGVVCEGTGRRADPGFFAAGKTGTAEGFTDAWFIGFTDRLVAGVWLGNERRTPMNRVTGGTLPAEIWRAVMQDSTRS